MEPAPPPTVEVLPPTASFRDVCDRFSYLENRKYDQSYHFMVGGRVITKRLLSKVLAFLEIARVVDDSAESDPFLCQLLLEDNSEEKANGGCESFKALLRYVEREVHVGDVIEATGYPEKTLKGRVSLHVISITIKSKYRDMFPGQHFDAGTFRQKYRESMRQLVESNPESVSASTMGYLTDIPLCKWTIRGVACTKKGCTLRHQPDASESARIEKLVARRNAIIAAEHDANDPFEDKKSKRLRAGIFARWLVEKFGVERLNSGSGVLDVAGGLGRLSFELLSEHNVRTTLVEPRKLKITKKQAKVVKEKQLTVFSQIQDYFDESLWKDPDCPSAIKDCSLVIGLHPDQATEPIVDFALSHNKPFAIVPCCVFHHLWPDRRVNDKPVVTYFDFVEYLSAKDSRIKSDFLDMSGRNKILWFDPPAPPLAKPTSSDQRP